MTIWEFIGSMALGAALMALANARAWAKYYEGRGETRRRKEGN